MKKLLIFILMLNCRSAFNQITYFNYLDSTVKWTEFKMGSDFIGMRYQWRNYSLNGDTLLNGIWYYKVEVSGKDSLENGNVIIKPISYFGGLREDSLNRFYFIYYNDTIEELLYDFNLTIGDTFQGSTCEVVCIDTVYLGNIPRKRFLFNRPDNNTIIEGVGNMTGILQQGLTLCLIFFDSGNSVTDYLLQGDSLYINPNATCTNCSAYFTLIKDTILVQHWYAVNQATGISPLTYTWEWGDGSPSSSGAYPSHTYNAVGNYQICLTISDSSGCFDTYCSVAYIYKTGNVAITINVVAELPNGVEELDNHHFSIYPNPTNNQLNTTTTLQGNNETQYQIINTLGATAMASKATAKDFSIDVSTLPAGIYFIHLQSGNAKTVKRFVKE